MAFRLDNNSRIAFCSMAAAIVCGAVVWGGAHFLEGRHAEVEHEEALESIAERREVADEGDWLMATSDPEAIIEHTPWEGTVAVRVDGATLYGSAEGFEKETGISLEGGDMLMQAESMGFDVVVATVDLTVRNDGAHSANADSGTVNISSSYFPIAIDGVPCSLSICGAIVDGDYDRNASVTLDEGEAQSMTLVYTLPAEGSEAALGAMAQVEPPYRSGSAVQVLVGNMVDDLEGSVVEEYPFLLEVSLREADA